MAFEFENANLVRDNIKPSNTNSPKQPDTAASLPDSMWDRFLQSRPKFVEPAFLVYNLAFRSAIPVHVQFVSSVVEDRMHGSVGGVNMTEPGGLQGVTVLNSPDEDAIQEKASLWLMYCNLARTLPAIFITLVVVSYGDTGGRRLGLLLSNIGGACRFLIYVLLIYCNLPIWWLVLANFLEGLGGTHSTITASAYSYISDVVPAGKRTFRFSVAHALTFVASGLGNLAVGYILSAVGFLSLFWGITILYVVNTIYIFILVPESNDTGEKGTFSIGRVFQETVNSFRIYFKERPSQPNARLELGLLLLTGALVSVILTGRIDSDTLYMLGSPFYFSAILIGYYMAFQSLCIVLSDVLGVPLLLRAGMSDIGLGLVSGISGLCGGVLQAFSVSTIMLFFGKLFVMLFFCKFNEFFYSTPQLKTTTGQCILVHWTCLLSTCCFIITIRACILEVNSPYISSTSLVRVI